MATYALLLVKVRGTDTFDLPDSIRAVNVFQARDSTDGMIELRMLVEVLSDEAVKYFTNAKEA